MTPRQLDPAVVEFARQLGRAVARTIVRDLRDEKLVGLVVPEKPAPTVKAKRRRSKRAA